MYKYRDLGRIRVRDESSDIGKGRLAASTFPDFFKNPMIHLVILVVRSRYICT